MPLHSRASTLKCFRGDLDGLREALVITTSQQKAASLANKSINELRTYWISDCEWPAQEIKTNCLYTKPINTSLPWTEGLCALKHE